MSAVMHEVMLPTQEDYQARGQKRSSRRLGREIAAVNVSKSFETTVGRHQVLRNISFSVGPGQRMAILGRNGAGKSTLIKLLAGLLEPTSGKIHLGMSLSWPLALAGGFEGALTGYDNIKFVCDIYDVPFRPAYRYVREFSELGDLLFLPVSSYSDGMRSRLAFGLSLAIEFDCILIDEVLSVGDQRFQRKCHDALFNDRPNISMIAAVHDTAFVNEYCHHAVVLKDGAGRVFDDTKVASRIYDTL